MTSISRLKSRLPANPITFDLSDFFDFSIDIEDIEGIFPQLQPTEAAAARACISRTPL